MIVAFAETGVTNRKPTRNTEKTGSMTKTKMTTQVGVSRSSLSLKKTSQNTAHIAMRTRIAAVMALRSCQEAAWGGGGGDGCFPASRAIISSVARRSSSGR